jgi:hypothetical protein
MDARTVVRLDALFEAALGVSLVAAAAAGALGGRDFPQPVGRTLVAVAGALLVAIGAVLWRGWIGLRGLAAANLATAFAALAWLAAVSQFSAAGRAVVAVVVVGLVALAVAEVAALR